MYSQPIFSEKPKVFNIDDLSHKMISINILVLTPNLICTHEKYCSHIYSLVNDKLFKRKKRNRL